MIPDGTHRLDAAARRRGARPRVGALGTGWIGRHRLEVLAAADLVDIVAIADPSPAAMADALALAPQARRGDSLDELLTHDLDGVVIATPTAQHASQARQALRAGCAVCCQKPLARTAAETQGVVEAAREADRLLTVDFSYRYTAAVEALRSEVGAGRLGTLLGAELVFHNASGPDTGWYRIGELAGGGCVMDLGVHLLDLVMWVTGEPVAKVVAGALFAQGRRWPGDQAVEDFAQCQLTLGSGATASLTCSWWLPAGCEAVIGATFYGTGGGLRLRNVGGSFYDFVAERLMGTRQETLTRPPDAWGGRAVVEWARRLAAGEGYDAACETHIAVSRTIDAIYGAARAAGGGAAPHLTVGTAPLPVAPD